MRTSGGVLGLAFFAALVCSTPRAVASGGDEGPAPEVHVLHVKSLVSYRCYGGHEGRKVKDARTGFVCDNRDYKKSLLDKAVSITIKWEPNPVDDQSLAGDWNDVIEFMGRKFSVAMTLFKDVEPGRDATYRLRLLAEDDEAPSGESVAYLAFRRPRDMNSVTLEHSSRGGQPVEIRYEVTVTSESRQP